MKKELYTEIKAILEQLPAIKRVAIWRNDLLIGVDTLDSLPMAFLQFTGLN